MNERNIIKYTQCILMLMLVVVRLQPKVMPKESTTRLRGATFLRFHRLLRSLYLNKLNCGMKNANY